MSGTERTGRGRVLLVTSNFPRWDGDSTTPFVLHLAQDLQSLGWQVDVLAPHAPGAALSETLGGVSVDRFRYLRPESLQTVCYQGGALVNLRRTKSNYAKLPFLVLSEWLSIGNRLTRGHYDIVNSHWILPQGFTAALASRRHNVPHVLTVHGGDVFALTGGILPGFKRFALKRADAITVNSSTTEAAVRSIEPALALVERIPMGVSKREPDSARVEDLRRNFRPGGGPLCVFVGRLVEEKGVADLVEAVSILENKFPDVAALVVGEGQDRAMFEALSAKLSLAEKVFFTGWVEPDDVVNYLAAADIFVGPSRQSPEGWIEAQGLTFAEALLAGVPVIATRSGGIGDVIRDRETGLLVSEGAPKEIAEAVSLLTHDPDLARSLVKNGQALVEQGFSRQASATRFSALFDALVAARSVAG